MTTTDVHGSMTIAQVQQVVAERQQSLLAQIGSRNAEVAEITAELVELRDELHECAHATFLQWARADVDDYDDEDDQWPAA